MKYKLKGNDCRYDTDELEEIRENTKTESKRKSNCKKQRFDDEQSREKKRK